MPTIAVEATWAVKVPLVWRVGGGDDATSLGSLAMDCVGRPLGPQERCCGAGDVEGLPELPLDVPRWLRGRRRCGRLLKGAVIRWMRPRCPQ